mgnify:CR=1 FL=1
MNDALKQIFGREGKKELSEFREKVENGTIIPLFVLDGYDELRQEHLGSNLYETNDLQDYVQAIVEKLVEEKKSSDEMGKDDVKEQSSKNDSKHEENSKVDDSKKVNASKNVNAEETKTRNGKEEKIENIAIRAAGQKNSQKKLFPKIIYLCRTEFLATKPDAYREWFRPGTDIKADGLLMERLIASFDTTQREEYFAARVTRNFANLICDVLNVDKNDFVLSDGERNDKGEKGKHDKSTDNDKEKEDEDVQLQNLLSYAKCSVSKYDVHLKSIASTLQAKHTDSFTSEKNQQNDKQRAFILSILLSTLYTNKHQFTDTDIKNCWQQIQDLAIKGRSIVWPISEFQDAFKRMSELEELTKTPFMLKICTDVIDLLRAMGATPARIKERTILASKERHHVESTFTKLVQKKRDSKEKGLSMRRKFSNAIHSDKFKDLKIKKTADEMWQRIKQNGMLDNLKSIQEWIDVYVEKKTDSEDTSLEKTTIAMLKKDNALLKILKRTPVDRYRIYKTFIRHYIDAEARRKQTNAISVNELNNEAYELSTQLALEMTEENLTKVRYEEGQHRFREENRWERFLGGTSEAMEMIRRVAPIQKGKL